MTHLKARLSLLFTLIASTLLSGCQPDGKVHQFQSVNTQGWSNTDTLTFLLPPDTIDTLRQLTVEARISPQYPYTELWLVVEQQQPNDTTSLMSCPIDSSASSAVPSSASSAAASLASIIHLDTIRLQLTNEQGQFTGTGRNILQYAQQSGTIRLSPTDTTRLTIRHIMHDNHLTGVHDIGIEL